MKINATDHRHVQTHVTINDGVRAEKVQWGDVRYVTIALEPGEVPDMMSGGFRGKRTLFRPERAHIEWKRNLHWSRASGTGHFITWGDKIKTAADGWILTNAGIRGTNVRVDGSLGKLNESALYANDDGWGISYVIEQPDWYAELFTEHDPNRTGSLLDQEGTS